MSIQLIASNVVIAAQRFNPSVVSQMWLVKNGLATEDDFRQGYVFTDSVVQLQASSFHLTLIQEQLQFVPKVEKDKEQELLEAKVGTIISKLPHTPYRAIGLNFFWHLTPDLESVRERSRKLFYRPDCQLFQNFDTSDANFGAYLSRDIFDCRLRLDVKPVIMAFHDTKHEHLLFNFNFQKDLTDKDEAVDVIQSMLKRWDEAKKASLRLIQSADTESQT